MPKNSQVERQGRTVEPTRRRILRRSSSSSESGLSADELAPPTPSRPRRAQNQQRSSQVTPIIAENSNGMTDHDFNYAMEVSRLDECMKIVDDLMNGSEETYASQFFDLDDHTREELIPLRQNVSIPMDLKLISLKLQKGKYWKRQDFLFDIKKMISNVKEFLGINECFLLVVETFEEAFWAKYDSIFPGEREFGDSSDEEGLFEPVVIGRQTLKELTAMGAISKKKSSAPVTIVNEIGLVDDGEIPGPSSQLSQSRTRDGVHEGSTEPEKIVGGTPAGSVNPTPVPPPPPPFPMAPPNYKKIQRAKRSSKLPELPFQPPSGTSGTSFRLSLRSKFSPGEMALFRGSNLSEFTRILSRERASERPRARIAQYNAKRSVIDVSTAVVNSAADIAESTNGTSTSQPQVDVENANTRDQGTSEAPPDSNVANNSPTVEGEGIGDGGLNSLGETSTNEDDTILENVAYAVRLPSRPVRNVTRNGLNSKPVAKTKHNKKIEKVAKSKHSTGTDKTKTPGERKGRTRVAKPKSDKVIPNTPKTTSKVTTTMTTPKRTPPETVTDPEAASTSTNTAKNTVNKNVDETIVAGVDLNGNKSQVVTLQVAVKSEKEPTQVNVVQSEEANISAAASRDEGSTQRECVTSTSTPSSSTTNKRKKQVKVELISDGSDEDEPAGRDDSTRHNVDRDANEQPSGEAFEAKPLSYEEEARMLTDIYSLDSQRMERVVALIRRFEPELDVPNAEEFEIDITRLQPRTLRELEVFVAVSLKRKLPRLSLAKRSSL